MEKRQREIIKIISREFSKKVMAQKISEQLGVSIRTIKSDIKAINKQYPSLITSSNQGYAIENRLLTKTALEKEEQVIPQNPVERVRFIINHLLTNEDPSSYFDFSDLLYVSVPTIQKDISLIQEIISGYHLKLKVEKNFLKITGSEQDKRKLLVDLLYDELDTHFFSLDRIDQLFSFIDTNFIKEVIMKTLVDYNYRINDFGLYSSIIHMSVKIDRIKKGYHEDSIIITNVYNKDELKITEKILKQFEDFFSIHFSESDRHEFNTLLISKIYPIHSIDSVQKETQLKIHSDAMNLARSIVQSINKHFLVYVDNEDFLVSFSLHIQNLKNRIKNNKNNYNPLTDSIKYSSPIIYEIAVFAANLIKESLGVVISDDEVAFIAIHVGSALEFQKAFHSRIKTYLIIPSYYSYSQKLIENISSLYKKDLNIVQVIHSTDALFKMSKSELIISVLPQPWEFIDEQWVEVSLFFTKNDQVLIQQKIDSIQKTIKQIEFSDHLEQLCSPELFFISQNKNENIIDVLHTMCNQLIILEYVEQNFLENVLKREELSSTAYFSFAIPHSIKMNAKKTVLAVYINKNGIDWNGKLVQLIILPCFNSSDRKDFNEIFEMLTDTLIDASNVAKIVTVKKF
ncbi:PTS sugar transporter subunit IIA [Jeotgalibaca sp. MA1X17-3]|uniref:BglG family transcription antiterminator n=1 Tax=Jeotgalibaca sp. MA1X17-3 TaxID=2908211 RepID=UPI001F23D267|nr:PTS sugar transporter subunit IIA [Jeotgalibaca sp. MA1X17-3]UJF15559.1 PTS sugar transporter subunit IIA [Jeotgalibaca sp. MA1X17-3]